MAGLTARQKRFIEEYLIDLNATQAAVRAGYSPKTAGEQGSRLLATKSISDKIAEAMAELSRRTGVSQERVIEELAKVAFVNAADVIDFGTGGIPSSMSENDTAAISSMKVKKVPTKDGENVEREIKFIDKLKALELLGRHFGMFTENTSLSGETGVVIVDDIPEDTG